jgi:adenylate kinase
MARLLIVGPQGSGKGTQGVRIAEAFGIPVVSTGDVFRANVAEGTELGLQVKEIIDAGNLVPDELTSAVVRDRLSKEDAADGFLLGGRDERLDAVIALVVPREESIERLRKRAIDQGRADDTEEVIAQRLSIYESETAPILGVYGTRDLVDEIDGVGSLDEVTARIFAALEARGLGRSNAA